MLVLEVLNRMMEEEVPLELSYPSLVLEILRSTPSPSLFKEKFSWRIL
jgi:hypothetical protein